MNWLRKWFSITSWRELFVLVLGALVISLNVDNLALLFFLSFAWGMFVAWLFRD